MEGPCHVSWYKSPHGLLFISASSHTSKPYTNQISNQIGTLSIKTLLLFNQSINHYVALLLLLVWLLRKLWVVRLRQLRCKSFVDSPARLVHTSYAYRARL